MISVGVPNGTITIICDNSGKVNSFLIKKLKNDLSVSDVSKILDKVMRRTRQWSENKKKIADLKKNGDNCE